MELKTHRICDAIRPFITWDEDVDEVVVCEVEPEYMQMILSGTLTDDNKNALFNCFVWDLECGTTLQGGIVHAATDEDVASLGINTLPDIYRVLGRTEEEVLREYYDTYGLGDTDGLGDASKDGVPFEKLSDEDRVHLIPDEVWAGRAGQYVFLGYGWSC